MSWSDQGVLIFLLSPICALIYGGFYCHREKTSWIGSLTKTLSVGLLAIFALEASAPLLALALALSALGDFALSRRGETAFLVGLVGFALAHAVYVLIFWPTASDPHWALIIPLVLLALSTPLWLLPHTGKLKPAVAIYVLLITAMGWTAFAQDPTAYDMGWENAIMLGAALFILSDFILSIEFFCMTNPRRIASIALWAFYYTGQLLLFAGLV